MRDLRYVYIIICDVHIDDVYYRRVRRRNRGKGRTKIRGRSMPSARYSKPRKTDCHNAYLKLVCRATARNAGALGPPSRGYGCCQQVPGGRWSRGWRWGARWHVDTRSVTRRGTTHRPSTANCTRGQRRWKREAAQMPVQCVLASRGRYESGRRVACTLHQEGAASGH